MLAIKRFPNVLILLHAAKQLSRTTTPVSYLAPRTPTQHDNFAIV